MLKLRFTKLLELLSLSGLLVLLTALPWVNFRQFYFSFEFSKFTVFVLLSGFLLIVNSLILLFNKFTLPPLRLTIVFAVFLALYAISTFFSISPNTSIFGYYSHFTGSLLYMVLLINVMLTAFNLKDEKKSILLMIFLAGVLVSVIGIWQYAGNYLTDKTLIYRIYATIGQPNRLAFYLLPVFPVGLYFFLNEKKRFFKMIFGLGSLLITLAFFLTFSRTSFMVFTLIILGILVFEMKKNNKKVFLFIIPVVAGLIFFGAIFARSIPSTITDYHQSSLSLRIAEWQGSINAVLNRNFARQLIGSGPETVYFTFFKYRPVAYNLSPEEQGVGPAQVRNYYLHLLSGIGLLGLLIYLYLLYLILKKAYLNAGNNYLNRGIFFSLAGIALLSIFYYQTDNVLLIFWTLTGLVFANNRNEEIIIKNRIMFLPLLILGGVIIFAGNRMLFADIFATEGGAENIKTAININPFFDVYPRNLSKLYMSEMAVVKDRDKVRAEGLYQMSRDQALRAEKINPVDIRNIRQLLLIQYYGGAYLNKKYHHNNLVLAEKLTELSPTDPNNWDLRGLVYLDLGKLVDAKKSFEYEKRLVPGKPGVYLHLGEVAKQEGKLKEAIALYKFAIKLAPGWDFAEKELEKALQLLPQK